jgi:copper(I)-binding protein
MNLIKTTRLGVLMLFLAGALLACGAPTGPSITVEDPWARPAMVMKESDQASGEGMSEMAGPGKPMPGTGAVFMQLANEGREADRLVGGQTDVAQVVEIHETVMKDDMMKMQMLADGLEIPAKGEVLLKPGGYHVMLIGMQRELMVGDNFTLELQFEKSGSITVEPAVREP